MKYIEFFVQYSYIFSFSYTIIVLIIGFLVGKVIPAFKRHKIKKCLSLTKKDCKIILPEYVKKLHNDKDNILVCPIGDLQAAINIVDLIYATGLYSHQQAIIYQNRYSDSFENYNIFCVGGSLANQYSYDLFQQFFPKFKVYASEEKIKTNPKGIPPSHFVVNETEKGFCWGNLSHERFVVSMDERYVIIVKLSREDFHRENQGTVHILFGNGVEGTLAASKYLLHDYEDLYKKVKRKKHYFIAFKIKRYTGVIDPNSFADLTNEMFLNNL